MACIKPPRNVTDPSSSHGPTARALGQTALGQAASPLGVSLGQPLGAAAVQEILAYMEGLKSAGKTSGPGGLGPAYQYQVSVLNSFTEYNVGLPGGPAVWADGIDVETGLIQDAKFAAGKSSPYDPPSMSDDFGRHFAVKDAHARLAKYKAVIESPLNPFRGLEIVTTDQPSADFFQGMMNSMGLPGRVRIE